MGRRATTGDQRDVPAGKLDVLLVPAADVLEQGLHALGRRDVVLAGADHEHRTGDAGELDRASAHPELAPDQLVLLVEVGDPVAEELGGEGDVVVGPLVEGGKAFQVLVVPQVPPEVEARREVHRRFEQLEAGADQVGGNRADHVDEAVDVEEALVEPEGEEPGLGEVDRPRHVDEVLDGDLRVRGHERGGERRAHAVAQHGEPRGPRRLERLRGHPRQDPGHAVLHRQPVVLRAERAPVQEVEVEPLRRHVLDKTPARKQVEDIRARDPEVWNEEQRGSVRRRGAVAVEPRLVLPVDLSAGRRAGPRLDGVQHQPREVRHPEPGPLDFVRPARQDLGRRRRVPVDESLHHVGKPLLPHADRPPAGGGPAYPVWKSEPSFIARPMSPLSFSFPDMKSIWPEALPESMSSQS